MNYQIIATTTPADDLAITRARLPEDWQLPTWMHRQDGRVDVELVLSRGPSRAELLGLTELAGKGLGIGALNLEAGDLSVDWEGEPVITIKGVFPWQVAQSASNLSELVAGVTHQARQREAQFNLDSDGAFDVLRGIVFR